MIQSALSRPSPALPTHRRLIPHLMAGLSAVALTLAAPEARGADIVWTGGNGEFTTGSNWSGGAVPVVGNDVAVFGDVLARTVTVTIAPGGTTGVGDIRFNAGTGPVTFNLGSSAGSTFYILGAIVNASGQTPVFNVQAGGPTLNFAYVGAAGDAVINNQGNVTFSSTATTAGTATINTTNGGDLNFNASTAGSAILNATDSTIRFGSNANAGNATITLNGTSALRFEGAGSTSLSASITANSGSLVAFTGYNFGGTARLDIRSGATLEMQNSSNPTMSFGSLIANGTVNIGYNNLTVGSLSGAGTIIGNVGGGIAPTVTVGGDNSSSSFSGAFTGQSGVLAKEGTGTFTFSGTLPTIGSITVGGGTFAWVGAPDAAAALTVNAGVLDISGLTSDPTVRQLGGSGGVLDLGARNLTISRSGPGGASFYQGVIQGTGGLTIGANTYAILTGVNTYTGATTITNPDSSSGLYLQAGGSIAQSSKVNLAASGARFDLSMTTGGTSIQSLEGVAGSNVNLGAQTLTITNGWTSYAGDITGFNGLSVTGGTQVLTGTTNYFGPTTVSGGTLQVDGSIALSSSVLVGTGGTLAGSGTVPKLTVVSGGFVAPGSGGIGTLNVRGDATLDAGSTTVIEVSAASADKLDITGTASLAGGLRLVTVGTGFSFGTNYTILSAAGGLTGTFNPVNIVGSFGPGIGTNLSYTGTDAILSLSANALLPLLPTGIATNPRNVAGGIDRAVGGGADGSAFFGLYALSPSAMPGALSALSGEAATGTQQTAFNAAGLFLSMMLDPMTGARGATAASASPSLVQMADPLVGGQAVVVDAGWSVWTKAYAQSGRANDDAGTGAASSTGSLYGVAAGADKRLTPDTVVGFALSGGGTSFGLGQARGSGTGDTFQAGLYGSTRLGDGYVSAALAYGWNSFSLSRNVAAAGLNETYASRVTAQTYGGRLETGWRLGVRAYGLTPYAALEAIGYQAPGYAETFTAPATGAFALAYAGKSSASVRTELGLRADARTDIAPGQTLITYGRLAWAYQARPDRSIDATFQGLANSGFTVFGARASMHTALASLGAELQIAAGTRLSSSIDAELGDRHRSIRANLGLSHSW